MVFVGDESVSLEMRSLFGSERPGPSKPSEEESFSKKAERLCGRFLSGTLTQSSERRRKRRVGTVSSSRVKEWTKNVVLIDYQGQMENELLPLCDFHKIFDGLMTFTSDMSEQDIREEIVRLVQLKSIPTHHLERLTADGFSFVKVVNRKVRALDGDVSCGDGKGLTRAYKSGSIYVRLNDDSLWAKKVYISIPEFLKSVCL